MKRHVCHVITISFHVIMKNISCFNNKFSGYTKNNNNSFYLWTPFKTLKEKTKTKNC